MKDFDDFVKLLTPEMLESVDNKVAEEIDKIINPDMKPSELSGSIDSLRAISSAVEIVRLYHEWLSDGQ